MLINEKIMSKILQADKKLGVKDLQYFIDVFNKTGSVEVGYRASCGATHITMKVFREWSKIVILMKKEGILIEETQIIHKNRYATNNGGFWNSVVFTLITNNEPQKAS